MTEYLIFATIIIAFSAVRVMRGGLGPQPPRWLMAAMPPVCVFLLTQNVYVAAASASLSALYVSGYGDENNNGIVGWEDWKDMAIRAAPAPAFGAVCLGLSLVDLYQPQYLHLLAGVVTVVVSNVAQTKLRVLADRLPGHGNRYVEGLEGAAIAALICAL